VLVGTLNPQKPAPRRSRAGNSPKHISCYVSPSEDDQSIDLTKIPISRSKSAQNPPRHNEKIYGQFQHSQTMPHPKTDRCPKDFRQVTPELPNYLESGTTMFLTTAGFAKYTYHGTEPYLGNSFGGLYGTLRRWECHGIVGNLPQTWNFTRKKTPNVPSLLET
jgi:hypothetical protein